MSDKLRVEFEYILRRCSAETESDTPDFILAEYLMDCLKAYDKAASRRDEFCKQKEIGV